MGKAQRTKTLVRFGYVNHRLIPIQIEVAGDGRDNFG
jgi:hypothetical protein